MSPSWTHRSPPLACSNPLWKFTVAQKSSQATRHFLPKCSSSAAQSSFPRSAPTPQPAKTAPPATQPEPKPAPRDRSRSARHRPPPSATDPGPRLCWIQRPRCRPDLRDRTRSRSCRTNPFSSRCRGQIFCSLWARRSAQTAYRCYSRYD